MADVVANVSLKCRVSSIDEERPRKETSQHFEIHEIKVGAIDEDDWEMRKWIALWILQYGFDLF